LFQKEAFPRDMNFVTEVVLHIVKTNCPDIAPWSEEIGPNNQRNRIIHIYNNNGLRGTDLQPY
jgi:hypothetical protein